MDREILSSSFHIIDGESFSNAFRLDESVEKEQTTFGPRLVVVDHFYLTPFQCHSSLLQRTHCAISFHEEGAKTSIQKLQPEMQLNGTSASVPVRVTLNRSM